MMYLRRKQRKRNLRRASVIVQGAIFGCAVGVGVAALAIDTGLMFSAKQELQSACDAAALAAASQLGATEEATTLAATEAARIAALNQVHGVDALLDTETDVVYGHAVMNGEKFDFQPNVQPYDAARVTLRRDATVSDGPVTLLFSKSFGVDGASLSASATAMLVPRDIALVIDLSASMNDDSELRHYDDFASEIPSEPDRPGVQVNLEDIWLMLPQSKGNAGVGNGLDPPPPGQPLSENDQQGTGPGAPANAGGNPSPGAVGHATHADGGGPRWGWMTGWGDEIVLGAYSPVSDFGLYYIPRNATCTDADVVENLTTAGYTANERTALLSGAEDSSSTRYRNRVQVLIGLAGWKSKMKIGNTRDSKYNGGPGNGDDSVDSNELCQEVDYPFDSGSWDDYVNYVKGSSEMTNTDSDFRYRYGLKTAVNYMLEKQPQNSQTPELAATPEEPLYSVKNAVQAMIDVIVSLESDEYVSLETFAQYGDHRLDLTNVLQNVPDTLTAYQAGHDTVVTNIGGGLQEGIDELTSVRARTSAAKVIIMLTDGKPNVNEYNNYVGGNDPAAVEWAEGRAEAAQELGVTVYAIGVGADVNTELCESIASKPEYYFFADNAPDPDNDNKPLYVAELEEIFQTLGGKRPVRLIQ